MRTPLTEHHISLGSTREENKIPIFFFSSRRRHTRSKRDWSSDVCSSDLVDRGSPGPGQGVFRIFVRSGLEILQRGGKVVDGLLENGAHYARLEGRVAQLPP